MYKMAEKLGCKMPPDLKTFGRSDRAVNIFLSDVFGVKVLCCTLEK